MLHFRTIIIRWHGTPIEKTMEQENIVEHILLILCQENNFFIILMAKLSLETEHGVKHRSKDGYSMHQIMAILKKEKIIISLMSICRTINETGIVQRCRHNVLKKWKTREQG